MPDPIPDAGPEPEPEAAPEATGGARVVAAILAAAIFLTRLPLTLPDPLDPTLFGRAMGWFPVIGAALGLAAGLVFGLLGGFGLPPLLAATLTVTLLVAITGGLHEDGLADTADGFGGGRSREHKLEIMRDSRVGSFGALALVLSVALRVAVLAALPSTWAAITLLVVAGAVSRAAMVVASYGLPPARRDGLSATLGGPTRGATVLALALALGIAVLFLGLKALPVLAVAVAATLATMHLARLQIGGQTGDVLGAIQQAVDITVMVVLVGLR
jgi:adenosylcobinamide-GDP ribazoletransferase